MSTAPNGCTFVWISSRSEVAFGYKGLQIQLFYTAGNLSTLFKVKYSSKVTEAFDCVEVRPALFFFSFFFFFLLNRGPHEQNQLKLVQDQVMSHLEHLRWPKTV